MKLCIIRFIFLVAHIASCLFFKRRIQIYLHKRFPYVVTRRELFTFARRNLIPPNWDSNRLKSIYYSLPATREESAYIIANAVLNRYTNEICNNSFIQVFLDDDKISPYALNAVRQISIIGALGGDFGRFFPHRMIYRGVLQNWLVKLDLKKRSMSANSIGRRPGSNFPILMYHYISEKPYGNNSKQSWLFTKPKDFEWQISFLARNGYTFLFADEINYADCFHKPIIITLDDGYLDNYKNAYPIIKKYNAKMTIFIQSGFADDNLYLSIKQVKELSLSNHVSIQSHTVNHLKLAECPDDIIENEVYKSKEELETIIGRPVKCIAYPHGSFDNNVVSKVAKYYEYGFAIGNGNSKLDLNPYMIKRLEIPRSINFDEFINLISYD